MKIRLWSDVHNEFGKLEYKARDDDAETVLVIAGDFTIGVDDMAMMRDLLLKFRSVIFCTGNHEYYNRVIEDIDRAWRDFADMHPQFYFLNGDCVVIDDVRFVGGILWTDLNNGDRNVMHTVGYRMNDYNRIRIRDLESEVHVLAPEDTIKINKKMRAYIESVLDTPFAGRTVVVTHHAPLEICIHPDYNHHSTDKALNFAYRNTGLESWFEEKEFVAWLHGHIHHRQEHVVHGKKVIANPRGYAGHEAMSYTFEDDKVFEV